MRKNVIINFHVINDASWFESVILLLKSKYSFVELGFFENLSNYTKEGGFCHITFDDGDKTFFQNAYPILRKHNVPATIFVSPKSVANHENFWFQEVRNYESNIMAKILSDELSIPLETICEIPITSILKLLPLFRITEIILKYQKETNTPPKRFLNMTLDEILEVEKSGLITIGAHTLNHPILKNESDESCNNEITGSILGLQKLLGHKIRYFAYPNGRPDVDFGEREIKYLRENNIAIAVSTESRFISKKDNKLAFPRIGLTYGSIWFVRIKLLMGGNWLKIKSLINLSESKTRKAIIKISDEIKRTNEVTFR